MGIGLKAIVDLFQGVGAPDMKTHRIAARHRHPALAICCTILVALSGNPPVAAATLSAHVEAEVLEYLATESPVPMHVIVRIRKDRVFDRLGGKRKLTSKAAQNVIQHMQHEILKELPPDTWSTQHRYRTLPAFTGQASSHGIRRLAEDPRIDSIGPDHQGRAQANTSIPYVGTEAYTEMFGLDGAGVTVAIFDSGIDLDAEDFQDRIILGEVFLYGEISDESAQDEFGHGTFVAGLLAASGVHMSKGMAPGADLLIYRVLDADGIGWVSDWAAAADHAAAFIDDWPNLRVSNSSFVTLSSYVECPCDQGALPTWGHLLADAYQHLAELNVVNLAAAGNGGVDGEMPLPACLPSTIAVGTVHHEAVSHWPTVGTYMDEQGNLFPACIDQDVSQDSISCFTNTSECLDILSPGIALTALDADGLSTTTKTGTSLSSPIVAGAAALLCNYAPGATAETIGDALLQSSVQVSTPNVATGLRPRLDLMDATDALPNSCGDGVLSLGETCDDGNDIAGDCCNEYCQLEADGLPCDDWDPCTAGGVCEGGSCLAFPLLCTEESPCAAYECDSELGTCLPNPTGFNGLGCDDGDPCTLADTCQEGECQGVALNCTASNPCATYTCVSELGGCTPQPEAFDGLPCDDNDACTTADACQNAVCAGSPLICDDLNPCTQDSCDSNSGTCSFQIEPLEAADCDDENPCTDEDHCEVGACVGSAVQCDDGNPCTADACDPQSGSCIHDPIALHGVACAHDNACISEPVCDMGACSGVPKACDDDNLCTLDACDTESGQCLHDTESMQGESCEDGFYCTEEDSCLAGECVGGATRACPELDEPCLENPCDLDLDRCVSRPQPEDSPCGADTRCEEGELTIQGRCDATGTCQAFPTVPCAPYQACKNATECATTCVQDDACISGHRCHDNHCVEAPSVTDADTDTESNVGDASENNDAEIGAGRDSGCGAAGAPWPYGIWIIVFWATLRQRRVHVPYATGTGPRM